MIQMDSKGFNTKADMVYEQLKEQIIGGFLEQGEKIVATEIAKQFGVSGIPVREALKKLESEGLVENIPHVGARVSRFNLRRAAEIFAVRLELESFAARLAAQNADEAAVAELQRCVDGMGEAVKAGDLKNVGRLNKLFHQRIYQLSGNEILYETIVSLMDRSEISRSVFVLLPERQEKSNAEHQQIVNAIRAGDAAEAERVMKAQKGSAFAALLNKLKEEKGGKAE